jgi:hypothetical protein
MESKPERALLRTFFDSFSSTISQLSLADANPPHVDGCYSSSDFNHGKDLRHSRKAETKLSTSAGTPSVGTPSPNVGKLLSPAPLPGLPQHKPQLDMTNFIFKTT